MKKIVAAMSILVFVTLAGCGTIRDVFNQGNTGQSANLPDTTNETVGPARGAR